jgi:hypothetical protein
MAAPISGNSRKWGEMLRQKSGKKIVMPRSHKSWWIPNRPRNKLGFSFPRFLRFICRYNEVMVLICTFYECFRDKQILCLQSRSVFWLLPSISIRYCHKVHNMKRSDVAFCFMSGASPRYIHEPRRNLGEWLHFYAYPCRRFNIFFNGIKR